MLDKTLPYAEIWMTRPLQLPVPMTPLAEGFKFRTYQKGDESAWSEIETSVGEFQTTGEALEYFQKNFAPYPEELERRSYSPYGWTNLSSHPDMEPSGDCSL